MGQTVTRILVPSKWVHADDDPHDPPHFATACFTLGQGPCGKTVDKLAFQADTAGVTIYQQHSDGSDKHFFYPMHTLTGRVEVASY